MSDVCAADVTGWAPATACTGPGGAGRCGGLPGGGRRGRRCCGGGLRGFEWSVLVVHARSPVFGQELAASAAPAGWTGYEKAPLSRGFLSRAGNGPYIQPSSSCRSSLPSWLLSTASNSAVSVAFDFASPRLMLPLPLLSIAVKSTL